MISNQLKQADFIIIGASFAGSLLAANLAKTASVALIDKTVPGRHLKCGGALPTDVFKQLNLSVPSINIDSMILSYNQSETSFPCHYTIVNRPSLDQALLQKAKESGVFFLQAEMTTINEPNQTLSLKTNNAHLQIPYKNLILATGYSSKPNTIFHSKQAFYARALVEIINQPSPFPDSLYKHLSNTLSDGYFWLFPLPNGQLNIGGGALAESNFNTAKLEQFKEKLGITGNVLQRGGGLIPLSPLRHIQKNNLTLFGDAAGMVSPLDGEGLKHIFHLIPVWVDALLNNKNLNIEWQHSLTYMKLKAASFTAKSMALSQHYFKLPIFPWANKSSALLRKVFK